MAALRILVSIVASLACADVQAELRLLDDIGHSGAIIAIADVPQLGIVYSADVSGHVKVHRLSDGSILADFQPDPGRFVRALAVNPNEPTRIALVTSNQNFGAGVIVLFDAAQGKRFGTFDGSANALRYSPDGRYLIGDRSGVIDVWQPDGKLYVSLRSDDKSAAHFIDERTLAYVIEGKFRQLDLDTGRIVGEAKIPSGKNFVLLDKARQALLVDSTQALVWNIGNAAALQRHSLLVDANVLTADPVSGEAFLGRERKVLFGTVPFPIFRLWGPNRSRIQGVLGATEAISALNSRDGVLTVGQGDGRLRRWRFHDTKVDVLSDLGTHLPSVRGITAAQDDRYLALSDVRGTIDIFDTVIGVHRVFDPNDARPRPPPPNFSTREDRVGMTQTFTVGLGKAAARVNDLAFFGSGSHLAISYEDGVFRIVDAATLRDEACQPPAGGPVQHLQPVGRDRILVGTDAQAYVWNQAKCSRESAFALPSRPTELKFDAQTGWIMAHYLDAIEVRTVAGALIHSMPVQTSCAVLLGTRLIFTNSAEKRLSVWNVANKRFDPSLPGLTDAIFSSNCQASGKSAAFVAYSGSGTFIAAGQDGQLTSKVFHAPAQVTSIAWSAASDTLLLGGPQRTVAAVKPATGEVLGRLTVFDREDWLAVDSSGRFDGPPNMWPRLRFADNQRPLVPVDTGKGFDALFTPSTLRNVLGRNAEKLAPASVRAMQDSRPPEVSIVAPEPTYRIGYGLTQESTWSTDSARVPAIPSIQVGDEYGLISALPKLQEARVTVRTRAIDTGGGIRSCHLLRDRQLVQTFEQPAIVQGVAQMSSELELLPAENEIAFHCFDRNGIRSDSARVNVVVGGERKPEGTAYVVAIGIDQYHDKRLHYAVSDARFFAATVSSALKTTRRYNNVKSLVLTDPNATRDIVLSVLAALSGEQKVPAAFSDSIAPLRANDAIILFFAGHGRGNNGRYELLMHDFRFDEVNGGGRLTDEQLREHFGRMSARDQMLVVDACEAGAALGGPQERVGPFAGRGFAQMAYDKGLFVLAAAQADTAANELAVLGHGLLTHVIVKSGLEAGKADLDPADGTVTVRELFQFALDQVPLEHRNRRSGQRGVIEPDDGFGSWQMPRAYVPPFGYNAEFILSKRSTR